MFDSLRKINNISVIVPTMNSAKYIHRLVSWLSRNFEDVIVGVDSKTSDNTRDIISDCSVKVVEVLNDGGNRVEQMLCKLSQECENNWVLRLDDDEFLSSLSVEYLKTSLKNISADCVAFHRKWCRLNRKQLEWMSYPLYGLDWQWRLFRKDRVSFVEQIHTPGIVYESSVFAPVEACIFHLDWIYHSYEERKKKVEKYELIMPKSGHREYYLYEDILNHDNYFIPIWTKTVPSEVATLI